MAMKDVTRRVVWVAALGWAAVGCATTAGPSGGPAAAAEAEAPAATREAEDAGLIAVSEVEALPALVGGETLAAHRGPQPGEVAPSLAGLTWVRGEAPAAGEAHVLFFWGTYCVPCKPMVAPIVERVEGRGLPVVAVSRDAPERLEAFLASWKGPFIGRVAIEDRPTEVHGAYEAWTVPRLVYVGADGRVTRVVYGPQSPELL